MKVHRKSHSRRHRKSHRKSHSRRHRKSNRKSQRGGSACSAMPYNREVFQSQRGGMAAIGAADGFLLDRATLVQAETAPTIDAVTESGALAIAAKGHMGGARRRTVRRHRKAHKGKGRKGRHGKSHRRQRGGMAPIDMSTRIALSGINPAWETEASVRNTNSPFYYGYGPQHLKTA